MLAVAVTVAVLAGCLEPADNQALTANTRMELIDWHVSGFWVINSPVAWVKVYNYNNVPITGIKLEYDTFDALGTHLDRGTYTIDGSVPPGSTASFAELYLGLVNLYSDKLTVKLLAVRQGDG